MCGVNTTPEVEVNLSCYSPVDVYTWLTDWMPCIAMDAALATLKLSNMANTIRVQACVQFAAVRTDKPSAPSLVGNSLSSDNEYVISPTDYGLSASAPGNTYVRFGVACHVNTAPNTGKADLAFQITMLQAGLLLPPWTGHPIVTDSTKVLVPVSGWLPALGVKKVQPTVVIGDINGSYSMTMTYRTATASPENPDAWDTTTGLGGAALSTNTEINQGELVPTTTGKALIQLGFWCTASGGVCQADVMVLFGIRCA